MKTVYVLYFVILLNIPASAQIKVEWVSTTDKNQWVKENVLIAKAADSVLADVIILTDKPQQYIKGFGTCFNESGWTSLMLLSAKDRNIILQELFTPGKGANFTICRMPLGANDFSRRWYSYNETDGDFTMKQFSIANDLQTLIPFIKSAKQYNPYLQI